MTDPIECLIVAISVDIFGTEDYESMLSILATHDGMVREFNRRVTKLKQRHEREDDSIWVKVT